MRSFLPSNVKVIFVILLMLVFLEGCSRSSSDDDGEASGEDTLTVEIVTPSGEIIDGQSVTFEAEVSGGKKPYSFSWNFDIGDEDEVCEENPVDVIFPSADEYTVTLTVYDDNGDSAEKEIIVNVGRGSQLSVAIDSPSGNITITEGGLVNFQGTATGGDAPLSYTWTFPGCTPGTSSVEDPGDVIFNTAGSYSCIFTVTDADGDFSNDTVNVTVTGDDLLPVAAIDSPSGNVTITEGGLVNFQGTATGGDAPLSYTWTFPGCTSGTSSVEDPGDVIFNTAGSYTCTFTVTDEDGDSYSDTVNVTVGVDLMPTAVIDFPSGDITIVEGDWINFQGIMSGGNAPLSCQWDFDGAALGSTYEDSGDITFNVPDIYTINFTVTDGDGDTDNDSCTVTVLEDTVSTVYFDGEDGTTVGWSIFDNDPPNASIMNVYDAARGSRVIQLIGWFTDNGFALQNVDGSHWDNTNQFVIQWSMKLFGNVWFYVFVDTSAGGRILCYKPVDSDALGTDRYVYYGLGSDIMDGQWHTFIRDLQMDLDNAQPGVAIVDVNAVWVRGICRVDNVMLKGGLPILSIGNVSVSEDAGSAVFTITASDTSLSDIIVDYATSDGTAVAVSDYVSTTGTVTISSGSTMVDVSVPIIDDSQGEGDETFTLNIRTPMNAVISDATGLAIISDDDF